MRRKAMLLKRQKDRGRIQRRRGTGRIRYVCRAMHQAGGGDAVANVYVANTSRSRTRAKYVASENIRMRIR
ncbi:hypothetical protein K525DRAFT_199446 [Schizophyllum commune Loenen D]|nr:hypothetical protein K525DRAFT_199446 [Schizophyllum commune Loenen D]